MRLDGIDHVTAAVTIKDLDSKSKKKKIIGKHNLMENLMKNIQSNLKKFDQ